MLVSRLILGYDLPYGCPDHGKESQCRQVLTVSCLAESRALAGKESPAREALESCATAGGSTMKPLPEHERLNDRLEMHLSHWFGMEAIAAITALMVDNI